MTTNKMKEYELPFRPESPVIFIVLLAFSLLLALMGNGFESSIVILIMIVVAIQSRYYSARMKQQEKLIESLMKKVEGAEEPDE